MTLLSFLSKEHVLIFEKLPFLYHICCIFHYDKLELQIFHYEFIYFQALGHNSIHRQDNQIVIT